MRAIILFFILFLSAFSKEQTKNPFLTLKFDKVIVYDYEPDSEDPSLINNGQISAGVKIRKQAQLDKATIEDLNLKLGDKKSYGNNHADCFEPHLGIVYYLRNKIVANITVCMDCNLLSSSIDIPASYQGQQGNGNNTYYILNGLSRSFRQFLNSQMKKYNFSHQIRPGSMFDN